MSKTVTLRLNPEVYAKIKSFAENDNRSLSNFIETSTLRYIAEQEYLDEFEMEEINNNSDLQESLKKAHADAQSRRGRFV